MGRIFEVRKSSMFARWDKMAKNFTRIGKEIVIAVKAGGPDPNGNAALRRCYQNARSVGMPKDRVEAAIKRAMGKEMINYDEVLYEGYGPHGIAILVETATDNSTRTVANVRMHFTKSGGSLGTSGSVAFTFNRMGEFKIKNTGLNIDDLGTGTDRLWPGRNWRRQRREYCHTRSFFRIWQYGQALEEKRLK
jgi:YebC/PmpR family DNA-binding regulatory protein